MRLIINRRTSFQAALLGLTVVLTMTLSPLAPSFARSSPAGNAPPPPAVGARVPLPYFGPPPSTSDNQLVGPVQLLRSGTIDQQTETITLPLYRGALRSGQAVWYILTDTTDKGSADALGLNYSYKLNYASVGRGARTARLQTDTSLVFDSGAVNFAPVHAVVPGAQPNAFPPRVAQPGSVGDSGYSPLARIVNIPGTPIYNAPMVAFGVSASRLNAFCGGNPDYHLVHDKVVKICPRDGTVTLALTEGFSFAKPVLYLSTEANHPLPAAMEGATYAPGLRDIPVGHDDSAFSPVERLFATINGPTGAANPQRQGFNSALTGEGSPLNVLGGIPTVATDYSPLWDLNVGQWTPAAITNGYRGRLTEEFQILDLARKGFITGPGGAPYGSSGFVVNCPIVMRLL